MSRLTDFKILFCAILMIGVSGFVMASNSSSYLSPTALAATQDEKTLFVACARANQVLCLDTASRKIAGAIAVPQPPSGLALSPDGTRLFVTCAAPESKVCIVDLARGKIVETISVGHTAQAPVISPDGKTLFVCNQFNNDVSVIDLAARREVRRIAVQREPVAADITKDGKFLLVANHLHNGRADVEDVAAVVSVIDVAAGKVVKELRLPSGSEILKDIRVSPDGKYAAVTHLLAQFKQPTLHVYHGWMNRNAVTIINLATMEFYRTMLLDEPQSGAANPWGVAWFGGSSKFIVTLAGIHQADIVDLPKVLKQLPEVHFVSASQTSTLTNSFADGQRRGRDEALFLVRGRERVNLTTNDLGPRAVAIVGRTAYVANYFSDTLSVIDLDGPEHSVGAIPLGPKPDMDAVRRGEFYFHDANLCLQGWQSCSSCHPCGARVDGLNWDLLNDGIGNPKNTRSLLLAHQTPPAMFLGVRTNAETAVRAGIKFILFTTQPEAVAISIDEYLKSLQPVPSPHLVQGKLSKAAKRGKKVFSQTGCADCHVPGLYTDLQPHDVGTRAAYDRPADKFYTPTLIEVWRTAPYLHNGSAATIRDVLTACNPDGQHGDVSGLSRQQIDDLCEFVLSL